jgi:hypothetical protein
MWSSSRFVRSGLIVLALSAVPATLAGCTFTPVYGDYGVARERLELAYSRPASRLDQLIIEDLSLKLGKSDDPAAPLVTISASASGRTLTHTGTAKPVTQQEATVNVAYSVAANGRVLTSGSRSASAAWTSSGQVLADEAARKDAEERAARAAGETVRLSILAALATPSPSTAAAPGQ